MGTRLDLELTENMEGTVDGTAQFFYRDGILYRERERETYPVHGGHRRW
jgi:hypothetical protein